MASVDLRTAASLLEKGDYEAAKVSLEALVVHNRLYVAAHVLLAKIAENQARLVDALRHWEDAYHICPMSSEIVVSYQAIVLRFLMQNPDSVPTREMNLVPPVEVIELDREDDLVIDPEIIVPEIIDPEDDLDRLIGELETARIVPDPDMDSIPDVDLDTEIDDVVSETLARIYASQNYYSEAGDVYLKLAEQHPSRRDEFEEKAANMESKAVLRN